MGWDAVFCIEEKKPVRAVPRKSKIDVKTLFSFLRAQNLLFGRTSFSGMVKVAMSEIPFRDQPYAASSSSPSFSIFLAMVCNIVTTFLMGFALTVLDAETTTCSPRRTGTTVAKAIARSATMATLDSGQFATRQFAARYSRTIQEASRWGTICHYL